MCGLVRRGENGGTGRRRAGEDEIGRLEKRSEEAPGLGKK